MHLKRSVKQQCPRSSSNIESNTVIHAWSSNVKRNRLTSIRRKLHLDVEQQVSESMFEIRGMQQQPAVTQVCVAIDWSIFKHRNYTPISLHRTASGKPVTDWHLYKQLQWSTPSWCWACIDIVILNTCTAIWLTFHSFSVVFIRTDFP